ncbi:MAG: methyl-accepting chemotaxis protein, partial [Acetobacteraceae bacterium]
LLLAAASALLTRRAVLRALGQPMDAARLHAPDVQEAEKGIGTQTAAADEHRNPRCCSSGRHDTADRAERMKREAMIAIVETIEAEATEAMTEVGRRIATMTVHADSMSGSADRTGSSAEGAATAAANTLQHAQAVASATEQLAAAIREIGGQVTQATTVVGHAMDAGRVTRESIEALDTQVGRIGSVADMISEIAARTNLLALNATIEAARAGEAGKWFAVVASEVKQLATQTARSTDEIGRHINEVRAATAASVAAVNRIEGTADEMNVIAGSIAASVEEHGAATAEIARSVAEAAGSAEEMAERIREVSAEAVETRRESNEMLENTTALNAAISDLRHSVIHVVRTASREVDRRQHRRRPCLAEAVITQDGQSAASVLNDISEGGCYVVTTLRAAPGQRVSLTLADGGRSREARVVHQGSAGLHLGFAELLTTAEADRISLATLPKWVAQIKNDHLAFVQRAAVPVAARTPVSPDALANHHHCRLGRWYDGVADAATRDLPSYQALAEPHSGVHRSARNALIAMGEGDIQRAEAAIAELHAHSQRVLTLLDGFGREYPGTLTDSAQATAPLLAA